MEMYRKRMNSYYPLVVRMILESKAIIDSEYPEFKLLADGVKRVTDDAYLLTMGDERISQWEKALAIQPINGSSIEDRRETVIARIRNQGKLNTELINAIVKTFTGGTANSWVENSTLYVEILPPPGSKEFQMDNVIQEIGKKIPAHLGYMVSRNYYTWGDIKRSHDDWQQVYDDLPTWDDVYLFVPFY